MESPPFFTRLGLWLHRLGLALLLCGAGNTGFAAVTWEPIPAAHRSARPPAGDPDAVAEILFSRIDLVVRSYKATQRNLKRVKIYSERAVEEIGKLAVEYSESEKVTDLAARVVHADGRITDFPAAQFQETTLERWNQTRRKARRLVVPRLAPGDIVEMQWRVDEDGRFKGSRFIYCQETIPVREFLFNMQNSGSGPMNVAQFGAGDASLERPRNDRARLTVRNLPAYVEEPDMPPAFNTRSSALLIYGEMPPFQNTFWPVAVNFFNLVDREQCAVTKEIHAAVAGVVSREAFREDQLRQLYDFCQTQITNIAYDESPASLEERTNYRPPRVASQVLKDRRGSPFEINCLFAALAKAAGFEARLTFSADRSEVISVQFSHGWFFMKTSGVLVKLAGEWKVFAPGERVVPFGLSRWQREETETFYLENDFIHWEKARTSRQQQAKHLRAGRLELDESGALEGDITETLEGQLAIAWREEQWNAAPVVLERVVREQVQALLPGAEVTEVKVENLADIAAPLVLRYRLRLASYAGDVGERRLIMPAVFHLHARPRYTAAERVHPIWWRHHWQEIDEFDLILPAGYEPENLAPPAPVQEGNGVVQQRIALTMHTGESRLHYRREAVIGRAGSTIFDESSYPVLKSLFAQLHAAQTHTVVLRPQSRTP